MTTTTTSTLLLTKFSLLQMEDPLLLSLLVVGGFLLYYKVVWTPYRMMLERKKPFDKLPMNPKSHWLLGHLPHFRMDFHEVQKVLMVDYANEYGQIGYWLGPTRGVSVLDYQDARAILSTTSNRNTIPFIRRHIVQFLGRRNIGFLTGKEWKFHRNVIGRAFATANFDPKPGILKVVSTFLDSLKADLNQSPTKDWDVSILMKMITMDVFGQTALSRDLGSCAKLEASPISTAFQYMGGELSRRAFLESPFNISNRLYWIPTEPNRRHARERKVIRDFLDSIVRDRRCMVNKPPDLLTQVLLGIDEQKNQDPTIADEDISEETLSDILISLLFAGFDTTSITLTYALYHVATIPDVERQCLNEIENAADMTDPDSLPYCKAVLLETLRLFPPGVATTRTILKPIKLKGGFVIPANTNCVIPIWTIQRMEKHFEKPNEFHPERWARQVKRDDGKSTTTWIERYEDEDDTKADTVSPLIAPANRKAFLAFSGGARSCVGMKFAMTEAILVFSHLIKHLVFELPKDYELHATRNGIVQQPLHPMEMKISWRHHDQMKRHTAQ